MKTFCKLHGCHFEGEKIRNNCSFFKDWGLQKLSFKDKQKVYDWLNSLPIDYFAIRYNIAIGLNLTATKLSGEKFVNEFERDVPGYKDWPDKKRRDYQRKFFLEQMRRQEAKHLAKDMEEAIAKVEKEESWWNHFKKIFS